MYFHWGQTAAKKGTWSLWTACTKPKSIETLAVVGWNDNRVVYIASFKSFESKRFAQRVNKVEQKYIQEQKLNQFYCYNQNMSTEWTRTYRIDIWMKEWWWSYFAWIVDVVLQNELVLQRINRDEGDDSLCLS